MFAAISPRGEMSPTGFFVFAGLIALLAIGTLVSGLHPRWRSTATWRGLIPRSRAGTIAFSVGAFIMSAGMLMRGVREQHGPLAGVVLWLFAGGCLILVLGPVYDSVRNKMR